tara:strand:- start:957 stop:1151 length:195 start_codon:yes stop_codon:yes gene_type:complete
MQEENTFIFTVLDENNVTQTREFVANDLHQLTYQMLEFAKSIGYDYVDMLEFSTEDGMIYRAET